MIYGAKNWNKTSIRYDQSNNIIEQFLHDQKMLKNCNFKYESCNVEATACAVEAVGASWVIDCPVFMGYGDLMFDFLNSPKILKDLPSPSSKYPQNEIMDNLVYAAEIFSDGGAKIHHYPTAEHIHIHMKEFLMNQSAIVLSYLTDYDTGHYITVVAYNEDKKRFICYDPWKENVHCERRGIMEEYPDSFFIERSRPRLMEVWKD